MAIDRAFGELLFVMIGIGLTSWVEVAWISRGMALALRETEYGQTVRVLGTNNLRVMIKHRLPNLLGPCIVTVTYRISRFITTEAFLSFIGLGVDAPTPSREMMMSEGNKAMWLHTYLALFPGIALAIITLSFNFLGDGLRDALDPRFKQ